MLFIMKGIMAISSFFLLVTSNEALPGGYIASNDIIKVQLLESEWGEAIRAGEFARALRLPSNNIAENVKSSNVQSVRQPSIPTDVRTLSAIPVAGPVPTSSFQSLTPTSISPFSVLGTPVQPTSLSVQPVPIAVQPVAPVAPVIAPPVVPVAPVAAPPVAPVAPVAAPPVAPVAQTTSYFGYFFANPHFSFPSQPLFL